MFMSLSTVLNNNKNCKNVGAYWNRGAYLQKHILWGALIRKGALIGRRALNRIITVRLNTSSFDISNILIPHTRMKSAAGGRLKCWNSWLLVTDFHNCGNTDLAKHGSGSPQLFIC